MRNEQKSAESLKTVGKQLPFKLTGYMIPRMLPVILIFIIMLSTSVPAVYFILSITEAGVRSHTLAREISNYIKRQTSSNPVMWKYDTIKIINYIKDISHHPLLAAIVVEDERGSPINIDDDTQRLRSDFILWSSAPITINNILFGKVWVGIDTKPISRRSILLVIPFLVCGLLISSLIYYYSIRLLTKAELTIETLFKEINRTKNELDRLNKNLEIQVEEKTKKLSKAYNSLRQSQEEIKRISTKSVLIQEEEKKRVARELHDSLGQTLTAIRIELERLEPRAEKESDVEKILSKCKRLSDEAINELRAVVESMRPPILDCIGLDGAINKLAEGLSQRMEAEIKKQINLNGAQIPPAVEVACYRIMQEALTNVMKHSKASDVEIKAEVKDGHLIMQVSDNGKGFDPTTINESECHGVVNIKERATLLGGEALWESHRGKGCVVTVNIPIEKVKKEGR